MKNKSPLSKYNGAQRGVSRYVGMASAAVLAFGVVGVTSCGRKSQAQEDETNLKLVGYDLDQTGFFKAIANDDLQALKIFEGRKFDLNQKDLRGRSGVYAAAESGSVRALNSLVQNGADIEDADLDGITPLMAAAKAGEGEVISYLLEKGADARRKDEIGKFALIHAMDSLSSEAINLLAPESRELLDTGLLYAADMNKYETIPVLVKYGASVYARNSGKTSLMIAAERGNEKVAEALLKEGANLYAVSDDGRLAKDFAGGNERVLSVLLDSETDAEEVPLALEWSEEELEALVQKAMERAMPPEVIASDEVVSSDEPAVEPALVKPTQEVVVKRIQGENLPLELANSGAVQENVTMAAYAEKSLPIKVRADDAGRVEIYDLRENEDSREVDPVVTTGSKIGMTGLRVKQIKKKMVNNKLTGGHDKELVTLMIEDEKTGQLRELYAGYESQAAEAVAVLKINDTGELLVVERNDEFYDLKGTAYKVMDVNDEEVIIENIASGELSLLPLMGVKK
ncbi:MAG: ankyrin repeat domain-containing protein [Akkermansiaceae bacterium]